MKKTFLTALIPAVLLVALVVLSACKKNEATQPELTPEQKLIGTWQLVEVYSGLSPVPTPEIKNGYTYTFMSDRNFIFEMNGYNYDVYNEKHSLPGECYSYHTNTIYVVANESKGKWKILDDHTFSLELTCGGRKRTIKYSYFFNDGGFLVVSQNQSTCDEGCYDTFKRIKQQTSK